MWHIWMRHVTHMHESCHSMNTYIHCLPSIHTCEWVMSRIGVSHVTHVNVSCHTSQCDTCEKFISHIWMSPCLHANEFCDTYEWVISRVWMWHIRTCNATHVHESRLYVNESCDTYKWVTGWRRLIGFPSCRLFSTKEPLNIGHVCGKWPIKIRDPMSLRHPVRHTCEYDTYEKVMSRMCMSHVLRHIWKSHVTHVHESCLPVNTSFDANGWVTSHVWMSHLTCECL